ncbi:HDOD domain-containing protein [Nitrogeniibacter mangrovi]|uniref:HDOD domain-containing protein n=1 Tax=Nitrogeniibacter mangrovi TaxID=2016596 RepID=A0A6C1B5H1_9RHOO|nr:HDOD domain-containing protein [Nitrogeniibacter mangrovi]QID18717.1 HDOD domain-containing protein [Nitrogeniibacter mangrovi]
MNAPNPTLSDGCDALLEAALAPGLRLPPRPDLLLRIEEMVLAGEADTRSMAREMASDAGLVAMLFKVARMSRYGRSAPPQSLEQVLQLLGTKQSLNVARCFALMQAVAGDAATMQRFWARSGHVALYASAIAADRVAVCNIFPDQAFLAGIFHDCGIPLLMQRYPDYCELAAGAAASAQWVSVREEDRRLDLDHCVVGSLVARHWGLPAFVIDAIRHHHDLHLIDRHPARSMVAILQLATYLFVLEHRMTWPEWLLIREDVMEELGIYAEGLDEYCDDLRDRVSDEFA